MLGFARLSEKPHSERRKPCPMNDGEFHIDDESSRVADALTADLRNRTTDAGLRFVDEFAFGRSSSEAFREMAAPLDRVSEEKGIPLRDVRDDLLDFVLVAALPGYVHALNLGPNEPRAP